MLWTIDIITIITIGSKMPNFHISFDFQFQISSELGLCSIRTLQEFRFLTIDSLLAVSLCARKNPTQQKKNTESKNKMY